jgi:hypothetical protein
MFEPVASDDCTAHRVHGAQSRCPCCTLGCAHIDTFPVARSTILEAQATIECKSSTPMPDSIHICNNKIKIKKSMNYFKIQKKKL